MVQPARVAVVAAGSLCAVAVLAFVDARLNSTAYRQVLDLWGGMAVAIFFIAFAAALTWALRPIFRTPDGLRIPPLALSVAATVVVTAPLILFVWFYLYLTFGGSK